MLDDSRLSIGVPAWLAGRKQATHWCPGLACWMKQTKHLCARVACWMNTGYALVSLRGLLNENRLGIGGMLDESRLSIGVLAWLAGRKQAKHWCPGVACWVKAD